MSECPVCCEKYTKTLRCFIECPHKDCTYICCRECVKTYISGQSTDPHCMKCHVPFERDFLYKQLGTTFMKTTYKAIKKELLFEVEKSRFPTTMKAAAAYQEAQELKKERIRVREEYDRLLNLCRLQKNTIYQMDNRIYSLEIGGTPRWLQHDGDDEGGGGAAAVKQTFNHPCTIDSCKGFMSSQWKCGLCNIYACSKCREILGKTKPNDHVCDEDTVKSIALIKKETRSCPKCSVAIYKISGCDQMWCTQCEVAFSWKTGDIQRGTIHNPHFYEAQRKTGIILRNPGDVVCGGIVSSYNLRSCMVQRKVPSICTQTIRNIDKSNFNCREEIILHFVYSIMHRSINHNNYILDQLRREIRNRSDTESFRVEYLTNRKDELEFKRAIFSNSEKLSKLRKICDIMEIYMNVAVENMNEIYNILFQCENCKWRDVVDDILVCINRFNRILSYSENEFIKIHLDYRLSTYLLNHKSLEFISGKPNMPRKEMMEYVTASHMYTNFK